jgi:hypothetical protein
MFNLEGQLNQSKKQAAQVGFSGTGILDVHPNTGVIRLKLNTVPPQSLEQFTENFSQVLVVMLSGMNVEVKVRVVKEDK